ncbi:MAG TPA: hypothetical protein VNL17_01800 [Verrucomicrobiae bacterium]|nr:hypothetical protein [Verrucomicrobiae bacterium]
MVFLAGAFGPITGWALTNSWNTSASDKWEAAGDWSLGLAPTNTQSIYVTNSISKIVTIDSTTVGTFPNTMTVNDLSLWSSGSTTNTVLISNIGTNVSLTMLTSLSISNGGVLVISNSAVLVTGPTNTVDNLGGSIVLANGSLAVSNVAAVGPEPGSPGLLTINGTGSFSGYLAVGLDTNAVGNVFLSGGQLALTNGPTAVGLYGTGQLTVVNGSVLTSDQPVLVGLGAASQGAVVMDTSSWIAAGHMVVGEYDGATGVVQITSGQLTVTNAFLMLIGGGGNGQQFWSNATVSVGPLEIGANGGTLPFATNIAPHAGSQGTLTMMGSTVEVQGPLFLGTGIGATGTVWMTGGQLVATNSPIFVAPWGDGNITISNGTWIGNSMQLGMYFCVITNAPATNQVAFPARGTLNLDGGSATLFSNMVIGNCPTGGVGVVNVAGGSLYVTNAAHNAYIDVRNGQLILSAGLLKTDVLILTNTCGQFIHTGGALIVSKVIFNTNAFQITAITPQGNDLFITWLMAPGLTNALQVSAGGVGGIYTTNGFTDIFVVTNSAGPGVTTNYLDVGGATNSPARYYRVRLVP